MANYNAADTGMKASELPSQQAADTFKVKLNPEEQAYLGVVRQEKEASGEDVNESDDIHDIPDEPAKEEPTKAEVEEVKAETAATNPAEDGKLSEADLDKIVNDLVTPEAPAPAPLPDKLPKTEAEEYVALKVQNEAQAEEQAFAAALKDMPEAEINVISAEVGAIISSDEYSKLEKIYKPEQRAQIVVALAEKRKAKELKEIRTQSENAKIEQARNEGRVREQVKELTTTVRKSSEPVAQTAKDLMDRFRDGDEDARAAVLLGNDMENFTSRRRK